MIDVERFRIKKHDLRAILSEINAKDCSYELKTYDLIVNVCEKNNNMVKADQNKLFEPIMNAKSLEEIPTLVEDCKQESLYWKMSYRHDPAYIIINNFGIDPNFNYEKHLGRFIKDKDIVGEYFLNPKILCKIETLAYEDGATLNDKEKKVFATHAHIINLDPEVLIKTHYVKGVWYGCGPDNPKYFGFRQNVNTRHLSALIASFHFPQSVIYTLGERIEVKDDIGNLTRVEDGHIRRYENGLITFSTYDREFGTVRRSIEILKKPAQKEQYII